MKRGKVWRVKQNPPPEVSQPSTSSHRESYCCPICIEPLSSLEWCFFPCPCNYRMCSWCLHQIREMGDAKCPQCRQPYDETRFRTLDSNLLPPFEEAASNNFVTTRKRPEKKEPRSKKDIQNIQRSLQLYDQRLHKPKRLQPPGMEPLGPQITPDPPKLQRFKGGLGVWD